uniref:Laminin subunit beta-1 n=1 Tax=Strongyloides papillosus TaxID=174720 RepID=A0A0N5BNI8_STREA
MREKFYLLLLIFSIISIIFIICEEEDLCNGQSCYPATGNLLIGRKKQLSVTSTCGLKNPQRYCIVSNLQGNSSCYYCDSRLPYSRRNPNSHGIENVIKNRDERRISRWWQAENGVQNVSIQLDLEAEFHFTHLIMTFKNFRPAAMLIERSNDYGKTWDIYRYFAYDCQSSFPGVKESLPKNHGDVICTDKYSHVSPSTGGELIYKVINPQIRTVNPYAEEVAKLLRITNLRINFTKLHTLGDDLLDNRNDVKEKYYYALYELIVRGSCSCYGHAQKCIPMSYDDSQLQNYEYDYQVQDMVYGKCHCTHNTKGLNCEKCEDFYNDLPWRPAFGKETNACKRCECNNHAVSCHFDQSVYENSNRTSGGVCDDCQHNTMGKNCEECKPYYYRDITLSHSSPYTCKECNCNKIGSLFNGICESEHDIERNLIAGKCYCKKYVDGDRCDRCKDGYWNLNDFNEDGCEECTCNTLGTINNEGCNKLTGECTCKRFVDGAKCDKCIENYYGLSEDLDGCKECDCDIGGSLSPQCDTITGQCLCKEHFGGRRCEVPEDSFYCPNIDYYTFEAEKGTRTGKESTIEYGGEIPKSSYQKWSGMGYLRVKEGSEINFDIGRVHKTLLYNIIVRYDSETNMIGWENVEVILSRPNIINSTNINSPCKNYNMDNDFMITRLRGRQIYEEINPTICLEEGVDYQLKIIFGERRTNYPDRSASILIDSIILIPQLNQLDIFNNPINGIYHLQQYNLNYCRHLLLLLTPFDDIPSICHKYTCSIAASMIGKALQCDCDKTGSISNICNGNGGQCLCKKNVIGRRCDECSEGTYGFSPNGCSLCDCDSIGSLDNRCDKETGQCLCNINEITGRQCDECYDGSWNFPNCQLCSCNSHSNVCDKKNGTCLSCENNTYGRYCERCRDGYYGDPRIEVNIPCKACMCPGNPDSGNYNANSCSFDYVSGGTNALCHCKEGYIGSTCDECDKNYWGNPKDFGGLCEKCECNGNVDPTVEGNCDKETGECIKCLYHTTGKNCELCENGYFGDGINRNCTHCQCNVYGSKNNTREICDQKTGKCSCLPNVVGEKCDECAENHYNLHSGNGCSECNCDPNGVILNYDGTPKMDCNQYTGQCHCKEGRGGKKCSECTDFFWGNPLTDQCIECNCNRLGSSNAQCNREDGTCQCKAGYGNITCDTCGYGYTGAFPYCDSCGECFKNWDTILKDLSNEMDNLMERENNVEELGLSSVYDPQFNTIENKLTEIGNVLRRNNITNDEMSKINIGKILFYEKSQKLRQRVNGVRYLVENMNKEKDSLDEYIDVIKEKLDLLSMDIDDIVRKSELLKEQNLEYAFNSTLESEKKSLEAQKSVEESFRLLNHVERNNYDLIELLNNHRDDFEKLYLENNNALRNITHEYSLLRRTSPNLNKMVCGGTTDSLDCDVLCGGPTSICPFCGGEACKNGLVPKVEEALVLSKEAMEKGKLLEDKLYNELSKIRSIENDIRKAHEKAFNAFNIISKTENNWYESGVEIEDTIEEIDNFLIKDKKTQENITNIINEINNLKINVDRNAAYKLSVDLYYAMLKIPNATGIVDEAIKKKAHALDILNKAKNSLMLSTNVSESSEAARRYIKNATLHLKNVDKIMGYFFNNITKSRMNFDEGVFYGRDAENLLKHLDEKVKNMNDKMVDIKVQKLRTNITQQTSLDKNKKTEEIIKDIKATYFDLKTDIVAANTIIHEKSRYGCGNLLERAVPLRERAIKFIKKASLTKEEIIELENEILDTEKDIENIKNEIEAETSIIEKSIKSYLEIEELYDNCDS